MAETIATQVPSTRQSCAHCRRPEPRCVCSRVTPVHNRTGVTMLQHPGERAHAFNSARLAKLGLTDVALHVAWPDHTGRMLREPPVPPGTALLYPRDDARDLAEIPVDERPAHLVVLDGTWPQAKRLYRDNPWLRDLPHVRLSPDSPSQYRIRAEPAPHCLSTIESIAAALTVLAPATPGLDRMLDAFLEMVNTQADAVHDGPPRHKVKRRPTLLDRLVRDWDRLLVCYGESVGLRRRGEPQALAQWTAVRVTTGETFSAQIRLTPPPDRCEFDKTRLAPDAGESLARFSQRWRQFADADDVVACWSAELPKLLRTAIDRPTSQIPLRAAYGNLRRGIGGNLADVLLREGRAPVALSVPGRASERLGNALAMAELLRESHQTHLDLIGARDDGQSSEVASRP